MSARADVAIPEDLQMLTAEQVAAALAVAPSTVREKLWDTRALPYVTIVRGTERVVRVTSLADLRAFIAARTTPAKAAA